MLLTITITCGGYTEGGPDRVDRIRLSITIRFSRRPSIILKRPCMVVRDRGPVSGTDRTELRAGGCPTRRCRPGRPDGGPPIDMDSPRDGCDDLSPNIPMRSSRFMRSTARRAANISIRCRRPRSCSSSSRPPTASLSSGRFFKHLHPDVPDPYYDRVVGSGTTCRR